MTKDLHKSVKDFVAGLREHGDMPPSQCSIDISEHPYSRFPLGEEAFTEGSFYTPFFQPGPDVIVNELASCLAGLERCVADLCELRDRNRNSKELFSERERYDLERVTEYWVLLWTRMYRAFSCQSSFLQSAHVKKVAHKCMQKGHPAFLWLSEAALRQCEPCRVPGAQELMFSQRVLDAASTYLSLYESWCWLKDRFAPSDLHGDLLRSICRHPLACLVAVGGVGHLPPASLRCWLLLAFIREHSTEVIDAHGAIGLISEAHRVSAKHQLWRHDYSDFRDAALLQITSNGNVLLGVACELPKFDAKHAGCCWILPWGAVFETLVSSGNKEFLMHLLSAVSVPGHGSIDLIDSRRTF